MRKPVISLLQMAAVPGQVEVNRQKALRLIAEAARQHAQVALLPELWDTDYFFPQAKELAQAHQEKTKAMLAAAAREHKLYLVAGSVAEFREGKLYNTMYVFDPAGREAAAYSKIHLFGIMEENKYLAPGERRTMWEAPFGQAGLMICYDLRFPELARTYALEGAQILFVPAAWAYPRDKHWSMLLRARAVENQLYVVGTNRAGRSGDYEFPGRSAIIDPWGETVIEADDREGVFTEAIDMAKVEEVRQRMPIFKDRRTEFYKVARGE